MFVIYSLPSPLPPPPLPPPPPLSLSLSLHQVWNLENMLPILALQRHEKPIQALAINQDSVFTGSEDMEIKVRFPDFQSAKFIVSIPAQIT